jgi:hypothetical protein
LIPKTGVILSAAELAGFAKGSIEADDLAPSVQDNLRTVLAEEGLSGDDAAAIEDAALSVLRATFYNSAAAEREYLGKLSRTYFLMCTLQNEPKVVEYFQNMAANLVLYIGADLLVRALSEHYLDANDQAMRNCFLVLKAAGAKLILTERVVEEVVTHLRAQDREFRNHYAEIERYVDFDLAAQIDRILIRSYFYARLDKGARAPAGWPSHLNQFCTYSDLHRIQGAESVRKYLCEEFGFDFETSEQSEANLDPAEINELATQLAAIRQKDGGDRLAQNDAIQVLRIYARRAANDEYGKGNHFGFRTYWLTKEVTVLRAAGKLIAKKRAAFWMRPEFVLNFIALSPKKQNVIDSYKSVFPSLLGVRLSNRLRQDVVSDYTDRIRDAAQLSDARARAMVSELSDKLKSDRLKIYQHNFD